MKVSLNCLKQYVNLDGLTAEEIADKITFAGVEVEEVAHLAHGTNLVIGEILTCEAHPDSDHLHILNVDMGKFGVNQIVCGAPNARKGLKVIVARVGAVLPEVTIKPGVIRGVESNGMCCSLLELGVDKKNLTEKQLQGIEELPSDAPVGEEDVLGYLGLDDVILDLNVLANRPDLLSVINIAREVGAVFEREVSVPEVEDLSTMDARFAVSSETTKCSQFAAKEIHGLKNSQSPKWMQNYLMAMGIRSIDALVDIGNYVMLITGQPLHMYDLNKLSKHELVVRDDMEGDWVALDDKTYAIKPGDICITCNNEVMCLGGVMGAKACAIDANTTDIVIEAASFDHATVRRTSSRLGLASESSSRFVKGTNHFQSDYVLNMAAKLVKEICGANEIAKASSFQNEEQKVGLISTSVTRINNLLGTKFDKETIVNVLTRLQFKVESDNDDLKIYVPTFRLDVTCDADIAEEVIRIMGFANVESELPSLKQSVGKMNESLFKVSMVEDFLNARGLDECLTYTLVSQAKCEELNYLFKGEAYKILNPLTEDHEYVRTSVSPSLINSAVYNIKRQNKNLALFEISNIITKSESGIALSIVLTGNTLEQSLLRTIPVDFYSMKGIVEGLMELFNINANRYTLERNTLVEELHPGKSAVIRMGKDIVGYFGNLHPTYANLKELDKTPLVVLELRLDKIFSLKTGVTKMSEISKFPSVERDLAFVVDKKVAVKDLIKEAKMAGRGIVNNVDVFDVFEGGSLDENSKSIALKVTYAAKDHTLKDDEVSATEAKIQQALQKKFKAVLRG